MKRRYKMQRTPSYYKNWCTTPFFAWIIHESEDGTKHVFTLLVVEMVRVFFYYENHWKPINITYTYTYNLQLGSLVAVDKFGNNNPYNYGEV